MPYELRPYPNETLRVEDEYLPRVWKQSVYPMAEHYGVKMVLPNISPQPYTHLAFEGFQYAKGEGKGNEYNLRVLQAFFQEEQDIGKMDVLTKLAGEIGLNQEEFRQALETRKYREAHQKALDHAYNEASIKAVPTFIIGDQVLPGVRTKESLEKIINEELAKTPRKLETFVEGMVCGIDGCE
jgi:predicted DsbA family dithiol-disulfide isomerase